MQVTLDEYFSGTQPNGRQLATNASEHQQTSWSERNLNERGPGPLPDLTPLQREPTLLEYD
jgi:hypothetical protein